MRSRFRNCRVCGRLAASMAGDLCSERCAELAAEGYQSPSLPAAARRPPATTFDARLIVDGATPADLPEGFVAIGSVGSDSERGVLVRIGAETYDELHAAVAELVDAVPDGRVRPYTLQRFAAHGLGEPPHHSNGGLT